MRQASRLKAFPFILIAAVLAVALPFNAFAAGSVFLTRDFAHSIFGVVGFDYFTFSIGPNTFSHNGSVQHYSSIQYETDNPIFDEIGPVSLFGRSSDLLFSEPYSIPVTLNFVVPLFLTDISSIDINFYFGFSQMSEYLDETLLASSVQSITLDSAVIVSPSSPSIDATVSISPGIYGFYCNYDEVDPGISAMKRCNVSYSSSSFFDVSYILLTFIVPDASSLPYAFNCNVAISGDSLVTTLNGSTASILQSLSIMTSVLESFFASENQTNVEILDKLDDIIAYFTSNGSSGGESEDILDEGAEKQEQLEELGQALGDVPKPSIQDVSQLIDPNVSLSTSSPQMVQTALNIVYSWDKFLAILALVIALGTISYILFGKKS